MKHMFRRSLAWAIMISLLLSFAPATSSDDNSTNASLSQNERGTKHTKAALAPVSSQKKPQSGNEKTGITDLRKADSLSEYKRGEAVVFLHSSKDITEQDTNYFGSKINIKRIWDFGKKTDSSSIYQKVAVVRSDELSTSKLLTQLRKQKGVVYAEPNYRYHIAGLTDDSYSDYQWSFDNKGQNGGTPGKDIDVEKAWSSLSTTQRPASPPVVAVIDTGVNLNHEDLKEHLWVNQHTRELGGTYGYDFVNMDADPSDDNGHGSHVAGIIAASANNQKGIAGINSDVQIMALKFLDADGSGYLEDAIAAYNYIYIAQSLGENVVAINNSWGGTTNSNYISNIFTSIVDLVGEKGAVSVWASGNEGENNDTLYGLPASMDSPYLISVAASNEDGKLGNYSNYGNTVDLAAPGSHILSLVSEPCYNPTLYNTKQQSNIHQVYENFNMDSATKDLYHISTGAAIDISSYAFVYDDEEDSYLNSTCQAVTAPKGFGLADTAAGGQNALSLQLKNTQVGEAYHYAIPYTASDDTSEKQNFALSTMLRMADMSKDGELTLFILDVARKKDGTFRLDQTTTGYIYTINAADSEWSHISFFASENIEKDSARAFLFIAVPQKKGDYEIQLDDIGISKVVTNEAMEEAFGCYDFYSGTSMAAPAVTAAVSVMSRLHPEYSTQKLVAAVSGMIEPSSELEGKLKHAGVLNFSYMDKIQPTLSDAYIANDKLYIKGFFLGDSGQLYINDKAVDASQIVWSDEEITVSDSSFLNSKINIRVVTANGNTSLSSFIYKADPAFSKAGSYTDLLDEGQLISDGEGLYYIDIEGYLYIYITAEELYDDDELENTSTSSLGSLQTNSGEWYIIGYLDPETLFGVSSEYYSITLASEFVYLNDAIYGIVNVSDDSGSLKNHFLVKWDTDYWAWIVVNVLPMDTVSQKYEYSTLAAYNSRLYLMGGYCPSDNSFSDQVRIYDPYLAKWSEGSPLPSARFLSYGRQIGNKLYVTLGGNAKGEVPPTAIFDGKKWTESTAALTPESGSQSYLRFISKDKTDYYELDDAAQSYQYYTKLPYYEAHVGISKTGLVYSGLTCNTLGDIFTYDIKSDSYQTMDTSLHNLKNPFAACSAGKLFYILCWDSIVSASSSMYTLPISSANVTVHDKSDKGGRVKGSGSFLPGTTTVLSAAAKKGYVCKKFTFDGDTVKGKLSVLLTEDHVAKVTTTKQISKISAPKNFSLAAGHSTKLPVTVTPASKKNKLQYKSANKKIVSVTKNGVIKAGKNALGKKVKITISSTDGYKKKAVCTVKISTPSRSLTLKGKTSVRAGKSLRIKASTMPSSASNAVRWKSSNKKYATVNDKGLVQTKKAGKGKTVTITATTLDGTKLHKSIQIRIS